MEKGIERDLKITSRQLFMIFKKNVHDSVDHIVKVKMEYTAIITICGNMAPERLLWQYGTRRTTLPIRHQKDYSSNMAPERLLS